MAHFHYRFLLFLLFCLLSSATFAVGYNKEVYIKMEKVIDNGDDKHLINFAVCAEGYTVEEMDKFKTDALEMMNYLFGQTPYKHYRNFFNLYLVYTPSDVSGINDHANTFFAASTNGRTISLATTFYDELQADSFPQCQKGVVLCNTQLRGGTSYDGKFLAVTLNPDNHCVIRHEMGHNLGGLADEYGFEGALYAERYNLSATEEGAMERWGDWIGEPVVHNDGQYFGLQVEIDPVNHQATGAFLGWYRPYYYCVMNKTDERDTYPYCPVCREGLTRRIHTNTHTIKNTSPASSNVTHTTDKPLTLSIDRLHTTPESQSVTWLIDGKVLPFGGDEIEIPAAELAAETFIEVVVDDTTALMRLNAEEKENEIIERFSWTVSTPDARPALTIQITTAGYGAFYTTVPFALPEGLTGGIIVRDGAEGVRYNECFKAGDVLPARVPVILSGLPGSYPITTTDDEPLPVPEGNLLFGSAADTPIEVPADKRFYVFSLGDTSYRAGFFTPEDGGNVNKGGEVSLLLPATVLGEKDWLLPDLSEILGISLPTLPAGYTARKIYTLDGIKTTNDTDRLPKGIYIVDGKKYVIE